MSQPFRSTNYILTRLTSQNQVSNNGKYVDIRANKQEKEV